MTNAKLTLKLDSDSISRAKIYSAENGISLSSMVERFFNGLTVSGKNQNSFEYSPVVKELSGIISLSDDYDYKADYIEHLESKYE